MNATHDEVVLDASALILGLHREAADAEELVRRVSEGAVTAHAPDLVVPECASALLRLVRAGRLATGEARATLDVVISPLIQRHATATYAPVALEVALAAGISAYDAFYLVLAEALDAPLVTADRRLAAAAGRVVLVGGR